MNAHTFPVSHRTVYLLNKVHTQKEVTWNM